MLDVDFANAQYRHELQRKTELMGSVSLPVGVLTGLGSLLVVLAGGFSYSGWMWMPFGLCLAVAVTCFTVAALSLSRAYVGSIYAFIPKLGAIASFKADLEMFYESLGYPPEDADPDFREQLTRWYTDATDRNTANNDRLAEHLARAALAVTGLLMALALCGILYVVDALRLL